MLSRLIRRPSDYCCETPCSEASVATDERDRRAPRPVQRWILLRGSSSPRRRVICAGVGVDHLPTSRDSTVRRSHGAYATTLPLGVGRGRVDHLLLFHA